MATQLMGGGIQTRRESQTQAGNARVHARTPKIQPQTLCLNEEAGGSP